MRAGRVLLVLHRPSSAENIGAAARVMKNLGFSRLGIVRPPSWDGSPRGQSKGKAEGAVLGRAEKVARRAKDVLHGAAIHARLEDALADVTWACGTTSRDVEGRPRLSPRELATEIARRSERGNVAVVFGEERRGLSDRELLRCQAVCTIPTEPAYDSMNLAQAVAVIAWELRVAGGAPSLAQPGAEEPARAKTLEALWARLTPLLLEAGFLNPQNPEHILGDFRRLLARAEPTQREAELVVAAVKQLERALRR